MDPSSLPQLEQLCTELYSSADKAVRERAEQLLAPFQVAADRIPHCQFVLDNSQSSYAQLFSATSLFKLTTLHWNYFAPQQRLDMRNYCLNFLAKNGPKLENVVINALIKLVCRITKLGWFEDERHKTIAEDCTQFLQASLDHCVIGLKLLNELIVDISKPFVNRSVTQHRKLSISFRDTSLFRIFQLGLTTLGQLRTNSAAFTPQQADRMAEQAFGLVSKSLSFDFIGTSPEETGDDMAGTLQVPSAWRSVFEDVATVQLFFDLYGLFPAPRSAQCLEALVYFASVRRSLFSTEKERSKYLAVLVAGMTDILRNQKGLQDEDNYHQLCRFLARIKANYQLAEIVTSDGYQDWIQLVFDFTLKSFNSAAWSPNSAYYLLGLWSRLVSSLPFLRVDTPSGLERFAPEVFKTYVQSRLDLVELVVRGDEPLQDPLLDDQSLTEHLEALPSLGRRQYQESSDFVISKLVPLIDDYQSYSQMGPFGSLTPQIQASVTVLEGKLTWLVLIVGALLGGRQSAHNVKEDADLVDGVLATRVMQLSQLMDLRLAAHGQEKQSEKLFESLIAFFQHFRKVYIGDHAMTPSQVYSKLGEIGLNDHVSVLNVMINQIGTNLKCWTLSNSIIEKSLVLFNDLASGYSSSKMLLKLDKIDYLLMNHSPETFPFLNVSANLRHRTTFHATLGRLLIAGENYTKFDAFMQPFGAICSALMQQNQMGAPRTEELKFALIGLFRDLRGVCMACNTRKTYLLFFEWIYPANIPLLLYTAEQWCDTPSVTTPLLKFLDELTFNKAQRLSFDSSSPNGILLFRAVSEVLCAFGSRLLPRPVVSNPYEERYKGIWVCMSILSHALLGNYVNFGVFKLYNDDALDKALGCVLQLALSIPTDHIMMYPKLCKAFFVFFEVLCKNHTSYIVELSTPLFLQLVGTIKMGLNSPDGSICSQSCLSLDHLVSYHYTRVTKGDMVMTQRWNEHLTAHPTVFTDLLVKLFNMLFFEDCSNQWGLSRPMLALIVTNEQKFEEIKNSLILLQAPERQQELATAFDKMMEGLEKNLESKQRDRFTQSCSVARHAVRSWIVGWGSQEI